MSPGAPDGQAVVLDVAQTEALALHAAAFNGMPDPVFHLTARAMAIVTGLAAVEPIHAPPTTTCCSTLRWERQPGSRSCCASAARARRH